MTRPDLTLTPGAPTAPTKVLRLSDGHSVTLKLLHGHWFWVEARGIAAELSHIADTDIAVTTYAKRHNLSITEV